MLPDRVSNPGPLTYESGALPTALRGQACTYLVTIAKCGGFIHAPINKTRFSCRVFLNIATCNTEYTFERGFSLKTQMQSCHASSKFLGPVVQSIVSLTSSLRGQLVQCFKTL